MSTGLLGFLGSNHSLFNIIATCPVYKNMLDFIYIAMYTYRKTQFITISFSYICEILNILSTSKVSGHKHSCTDMGTRPLSVEITNQISLVEGINPFFLIVMAFCPNKCGDRDKSEEVLKVVVSNK